MSLFSIETLYFISLGVIGCLILLLIVHFRNKLLHLETQVHDFHTIAKDLITEMRKTQLSYSMAAPKPFPVGFTDNFIVRKADRDVDEEEDEEEEEEGDEEKTIVINVGETVEWGNAGVIEEVDVSQEVDVCQEVDVSEEELKLDDLVESKEEVEEEEEDNSTVNTGSKTEYKKMTVQQLRQLALERGIVSVNQKLKKHELLELFQK